jgi:hypothetical protein
MANRVPPTKDGELDDFASNASTIITSAPTVIGLTSSQATTLAGLVADFHTRRLAVADPATKTRVTVEARDTSKAALLLYLRQLLRIVNFYPGTTNAQRAALGMNIPPAERGTRPRPTTQPVVNVAGTGGGEALVRLRDELAPDRVAKPADVASALISFVVTDADAPQPAFPASTFNAVATRTNYRLALPADSVGRRVWVQACWANETGLAGPPSVVTSALIAA